MDIKLNQEAFQIKVTESLKGLENDLIDPLALRGKQDAQKAEEVSKEYVQASVLDYVQSKVQGKHDDINQEVNSVTNKDALDDLEEATKKQSTKNQALIHDKQQEELQLQKRQKQIKVDPLKHKYHIWFIIGAAFLGSVDGLTAYNPLRHIYPIVSAILLSTGIAIVIAFSHMAYCPWISAAKTKVGRRIREAVVLIAAFIIFYVIGTFRMQAMRDVIDLSVQGSAVQLIQAPQLSPLTIALVSFAMFWIVFAVSFKFSKTKEERQIEDELDSNIKKQKLLQLEIKELNEENNRLEQRLQEEKKFHRFVMKFSQKAKEQAKNIGENAIKAYKHNYACSRSTVPGFFASIGPLDYSDNLFFLN